MLRQGALAFPTFFAEGLEVESIEVDQHDNRDMGYRAGKVKNAGLTLMGNPLKYESRRNQQVHNMATRQIKLIKPFVEARHDYDSSLKRFVDEANLLATAVETYLSFTDDVLPLPAVKLLRERLAAFNNARFGEGP